MVEVKVIDHIDNHKAGIQVDSCNPPVFTCSTYAIVIFIRISYPYFAYICLCILLNMKGFFYEG